MGYQVTGRNVWATGRNVWTMVTGRNVWAIRSQAVMYGLHQATGRNVWTMVTGRNVKKFRGDFVGNRVYFAPCYWKRSNWTNYKGKSKAPCHRKASHLTFFRLQGVMVRFCEIRIRKWNDRVLGRGVTSRASTRWRVEYWYYSSTN